MLSLAGESVSMSCVQIFYDGMIPAAPLYYFEVLSTGVPLARWLVVCYKSTRYVYGTWYFLMNIRFRSCIRLDDHKKRAGVAQQRARSSHDSRSHL